MENETKRRALHQFVECGDIESATQLLENYAAEFGFEPLLNELIQPVLTETGRAWSECDNGVQLAHGYIAARIVEDLLDRHPQWFEIEGPTETSRGIVVLGNAEDDFHVVGKRIVATFLRTDGWHVIDLGCDVLAEDFLDVALAEKADVVAVSAMTYSAARNIAQVADALRSHDDTRTTKLAVGGAVFTMRPELAAQLGADGTARNASEARRLFQQLLGERNLTT